MEFLEGIQPREYQQRIFQTCIEKNCLVVLPTGLGKTLIAIMLSIDRLKKFPTEKIVFLAPTKPLIEQHINYFKKYLPELFAEMNLFTGSVSPEKRKKLWQESNIIFSTPQCVEGETIIFTEEGPIKIKDFFEQFTFKPQENSNGLYVAEINQKVLGYKNKKICFVNAIKAIKTSANKTIKIKTEIGNFLECTPQHPLLTITPKGEIKWERADNLKEESYIASIKDMTLNEENINLYKLVENSRLKLADKKGTLELLRYLKEKNKEIPLKLKEFSRFRYNFIPIKDFFEISKKTSFLIPEKIIVTDWTGKSKPIKLPHYLDKKLGYVIGAMLGDGHIGDRKGHGNEVVLSDLDSKQVSSNFKEVIKELFEEEMKEDKNKGLVSYNSALSEVLSNFGVPRGRKAKKIRVPRFIFFSPIESVAGFLKGIFDTDGSAGKHAVSISSVSREFIEDLKWLFLRIGILGNIEKRISKGIIDGRKLKETVIHTFRFSGRRQLERFLKFCNPDSKKIQKLIETLEKTKKPFTRSKEIIPIQDLLKEIYSKNKNKFSKYFISCLSKDNLRKISLLSEGEENESLKELLSLPIRWTKIKSIEESRESKIVYDFTVEKDHNFITNFIISHNCVANDLRKRLYDLSEVCLLIEDEAHRCIKNYDYNYVANKYQEQALHQRIIGLTASPGSERDKIKQICKNLSIEEVELRTRDSEDVKPYLQERGFEKILVQFPPEFEEMRLILKKIFDTYVEELRNRGVLYGPVNKIILIQLQQKIMAGLARSSGNFNYMHAASACAQAVKIQHALELLETQTLTSFTNYLRDIFNQAANKKSRGVQKLVSKSEFNFVYTRANELLNKGFEHPKLIKIEEILKKEIEENKKAKIIVFTQFRDSASTISKAINKNLEIKSKVFVGQAKKTNIHGIATGLNQKEQKKIIEEFSEGEINVLVATSIHPDEYIVIKKEDKIFLEKIGKFVEQFLNKDEYKKEINGYEVLTNDENRMFFAPLTHVHKHISKNNCSQVKLSSGLDCFITKDHSLFSFNESQKFVPAIPEMNKFVALSLNCPNIETNTKIDTLKELKLSKEDTLFGTVHGLNQAKIRMLKTDFNVLSKIDNKKSISDLTKTTNRNYSTITSCLKKLSKQNCIIQRREPKNYKNVSEITKEGGKYLKFLIWFLIFHTFRFT